MPKDRKPLLPINPKDPKCYYNTASAPGGVLRRISNFRLRVLRTQMCAKGLDRTVILESHGGEVSNQVTLPPAAMAHVLRFREFCLDQGGFIFMGTQRDLDLLAQDIAAECAALK